MNPQNPHDSFFKYAFSIQQVAEDFITQFLPKTTVQHLNLKHLKLDNTSYIDKKLEVYFSDIVYSCVVKGRKTKVIFLFEHKSYPVKYPHLQLMRYLLNIWEKNQDDKKELVGVIPVLFYHGKKTWKYRSFTSFFEFPSEDFYQYIPKFDYQFVNLNNYDDEFIIALKMGFLVNTLLALKHNKESDYLSKHYERIFLHGHRYVQTPDGENFIEALLVYILYTTDIHVTKVDRIIENLSPKIKSTAMTTYERILKKGEEEGKKKGIQEGMQKGEYEKLKKVVSSVRSKYPAWSLEQISELLGESSELIQKIWIELDA